MAGNQKRTDSKHPVERYREQKQYKNYLKFSLRRDQLCQENEKEREIVRDREECAFIVVPLSVHQLVKGQHCLGQNGGGKPVFQTEIGLCRALQAFAPAPRDGGTGQVRLLIMKLTFCKRFKRCRIAVVDHQQPQHHAKW